MNMNQKRVTQAFRRSLDWVAAHPELLPPPASTTGTTTTPASGGVPAASAALATQVTNLTGVVSRLTQNAADQDAQRKLSSTDSGNSAELLATLRTDNMRPIVRVAQALRSTVPGIGGALKMPKPNIDAEALASAANAMAQNAAIYQDVLIEHGLPQDFITQLNSAAAAVTQSIDTRGAARAKAKGATEGIRVDLALGRSIVSLMDTAITRILRDQPALLASWENAKRVMAKGVAGTISPETSSGTSTPAPVAATAGEAGGAAPVASEVKAAA